MIGRKRPQTPDAIACREVLRRLQRYLDGEADDLTSRRIAAHLLLCRACGMNAATYTEIKAALARTSTTGDQLALRRLQAFADSVAAGRIEAHKSGRRAQ